MRKAKLIIGRTFLKIQVLIIIYDATLFMLVM